MDLRQALPQTPRGKDAIMVVVDWFFNMVHFIACHKCDNVTCVVILFLQKIIGLHGVPRTIVSDGGGYGG